MGNNQSPRGSLRTSSLRSSQLAADAAPDPLFAGAAATADAPLAAVEWEPPAVWDLLRGTATAAARSPAAAAADAPVLGKGRFGTVVPATLCCGDPGAAPRRVALKTVPLRPAAAAAAAKRAGGAAGRAADRAPHTGASMECDGWASASSCPTPRCGSTSAGSSAAGASPWGTASSVAATLDELGGGARNALREVGLHRRIRHRNVLGFVAAWVEHGDADDDAPPLHLRIALELAAGGSLGDRIRAAPRHRLPPAEARACFSQVAAALAYLHSVGACHRDVKPDNVLIAAAAAPLEADGAVQLCDFGCCATCAPPRPGGGGAGSRRTLRDCVGTLPYMAPEVMARSSLRLVRGLCAEAGWPDEGYHGPRADCWSLGVSTWEALHGGRPFAAEGRELFRAVLFGDAPPPRAGGPAAAALLRRLLSKAPAERPAASELLRAGGAVGWLAPRAPGAAA